MYLLHASPRFAPGSLLFTLGALALLGCSIDSDDLFGDPADGISSSKGGESSDGGAPTGGGKPDGGASTDGGGAQGAGSVDGGGTSDGGGGGVVTPDCGNGQIDGLEECDGQDFGGLDCTDFGSDEPEGLVCDACAIDNSQCPEGSECGNGTQDPMEDCDDGNLLGNDGCSATCQDEGTCMAPIALAIPMGETVVFGNTTNAPSQKNTNGLGPCTTSTGPELAFQITPAQTGILTAYLPSSGTKFDSVLYASSSCMQFADSAVCHDNFGTSGNEGAEVLSFPVTMGQPFFLWVDGYEPDELGEFELRIDLSRGDTCEDPVPIVIEGDGTIDLYGNTTGLANNGGSSLVCQTAGAGPDIVYQVDFTDVESFTFSLFGSHNTVVHARETCSDVGSEIDCDSNATSNNSAITFTPEEDRAFIWADGTTNSAGFYTLRVAH